MRSPDFENLNSVKPDLATINRMQRHGYIKDGSPLWWSTDYTPDPREYLTFEKFQARLVHLGDLKTQQRTWITERRLVHRNVYLYPEPQVPMTVLELEVNKRPLPFLITARPYHPKELQSNPFPFFILNHPLDSLTKFISSGGLIDIPDHFYPHIRGLFAGRRGNHLFWYPINILSWWKQTGEPITKSLAHSDLSYIALYNAPFMGESRFPGVWDGLIGRRLVDQRHPTWPNFSTEETSAEDFLRRWKKPKQKEPLVYYPLRKPDLEVTLPLVVTAITNKESKTRKPVVLGVYADNGLVGHARIDGICRIRNNSLAEYISQSITEDFGTEVDAVLYTPQPGRPLYERVSTSS